MGGLVEPVTGYLEKQPSEVVSVGVDWTDRLAEGEVLVSVTGSAVNIKTGESAPQVLDSMFITGNVSAVRLKNGTAGNTYKITLVVSTSLGAVYEADINMYVVNL